MYREVDFKKVNFLCKQHDWKSVIILVKIAN